MESEIAHTRTKPHTVSHTHAYINACINVCGAAEVGIACVRLCWRAQLCGSGRTVPAGPCVTTWNSCGKRRKKKKTQAAKLRQQMHHSLNLLHSFDQPSSGKTYENIPVVVVIFMTFKDFDGIFPK